MKRFWALMFIALLIGCGSWVGANLEVTTTSVITIASRAVDDTGTYVTPDSVRIVVYREGVEAFDAWFNSADGQCSALNNQLVFFDAFGDIDGDAGTGIYQVSANFYKGDDEYWINTWYELVDTTQQTFHSLNYLKTKNIHETIEPYRNRKNLYVVPDGDAVNGGAATTWATACSLNTVLERATGADEYYIYVAPGTYRNVEVTDSIGNTHWIGSGVGRTILWGKVDDPPDGIGGIRRHVFQFEPNDTLATEIYGFELHGYEATSGMEDSVTNRGFRINEPASGYYIHDNAILNFYDAINICSNTQRGRIENNVIWKPTNCGIYASGGYQTKMENNIIDSLISGRSGFYITAYQGSNILSNNIVNATSGRAFYLSATSKGNILVGNYVRALSDSAFVEGGSNIFIANHRRSQVSDPQTIEEDIYNAPRSANFDSGYTKPLSDDLNTFIAMFDSLRNKEWGVRVDSIDTAAARKGIWNVQAGSGDFTTGSAGDDLVIINSKMPSNPGICLSTLDWTTSRAHKIDSILFSISPKYGWTDSTGTTTMARDSSHFASVADDFYNGMLLQFTNGNNVGLVRLITDFGNYGEFTLAPALPNAVASGEFFRILSASEDWLYTFRDSVENAITDDNKANFKADISGVSTFDPTSDSVMTANPPAYQSSGDTNTFDITNQLANRPAIGDTNTNPFQAGTDDVLLASNYAQIANDNYDTLFVHKENFHSSGDTNTNPFQAGTDDVILTSNLEDIAHRNYDTMYVHRDDFKGGTADSVYLYDSEFPVIANKNYDTMYVHRDEFKGGTADSVYLYDVERAEISHDVYDTMLQHASDFHSSGDTNTFDIVSQLANRPAIGDTNSDPFDPSSDSVMTANPPAYKADVSGLSTFDPSTDVVVRVTYVDSAETVITQPAGGSGSDTTQISLWYHNNYDRDSSGSIDRVTYVDSTDTILKDVGATATVDTESVARSTWNDDIIPQASRTVTASCAGSGADTFDIYILDGDTTAIEGVDITIYNNAKTAVPVPSRLTDVNGKAQVFLDADTYQLYMQRLGVIYNKWDTITVTNNGVDTIWVTRQSTSSPPSANLTRIRADLRTLTYGQIISGAKVSFALHDQNVFDTTQTHWVLMDPRPIVVSCPTGSLIVDVTPSVNLLSKNFGVEKDSVRYDITISAPGAQIFEWNNIFIPRSEGEVWLNDLFD